MEKLTLEEGHDALKELIQSVVGVTDDQHTTTQIRVPGLPVVQQRPHDFQAYVGLSRARWSLDHHHHHHHLYRP